MLAGLERFLVEFVRAKDDRFLGPFTIAQVTSVLLIIIGTVVWVRFKNSPMKEPGAYLAGRQPAPASNPSTTG